MAPHVGLDAVVPQPVPGAAVDAARAAMKKLIAEMTPEDQREQWQRLLEMSRGHIRAAQGPGEAEAAYIQCMQGTPAQGSASLEGKASEHEQCLGSV